MYDNTLFSPLLNYHAMILVLGLGSKALVPREMSNYNNYRRGVTTGGALHDITLNYTVAALLQTPIF